MFAQPMTATLAASPAGVSLRVRDGFETARAVRAASAPRTRGIPLLALSAHDGPEHAALLAYALPLA